MVIPPVLYVGFLLITKIKAFAKIHKGVTEHAVFLAVTAHFNTPIA
jgi:hypothetical protein